MLVHTRVDKLKKNLFLGGGKGEVNKKLPENRQKNNSESEVGCNLQKPWGKQNNKDKVVGRGK